MLYFNIEVLSLYEYIMAVSCLLLIVATGSRWLDFRLRRILDRSRIVLPGRIIFLLWLRRSLPFRMYFQADEWFCYCRRQIFSQVVQNSFRLGSARSARDMWNFYAVVEGYPVAIVAVKTENPFRWNKWPKSLIETAAVRWISKLQYTLSKNLLGILRTSTLLTSDTYRLSQRSIALWFFLRA